MFGPLSVFPARYRGPVTCFLCPVTSDLLTANWQRIKKTSSTYFWLFTCRDTYIHCRLQKKYIN